MTPRSLVRLLSVAALLTVAGCDSAPDGPIDTDDLVVTLVSGASAGLSPGEIASVTVQGTAGAATFTASVAGATYPLVETAPDTLSFVVPVLPAGRHALVVEAAGRSGRLAFTVAPYDAIEDPAAFVSARADQAAAALAALAAEETDAEVRAALARARADVEAAVGAQWNALSADQKAMAAYVLRAAEAEGVAGRLSARAGRPDDCEYLDDLFRSGKVLAWSGAYTAAALYSAAAWGPFMGPVVIVTGGIAGGVFFHEAATFTSLLIKIYTGKECGVERVVRPTEDDDGLLVASVAATAFAGPAARAGVLAFRHGQARLVPVETGYALEPGAEGPVARVRGLFGSVRAVIPSAWLAALDRVAAPDWRPGPPPGLALGAVSPSGIKGTMSVSGTRLNLTFELGEGENQGRDPRPFTFELVGASGLRSTLEATLAPTSDCYADVLTGVWTLTEHQDGALTSTTQLTFDRGEIDGGRVRGTFVDSSVGQGTYSFICVATPVTWVLILYINGYRSYPYTIGLARSIDGDGSFYLNVSGYYYHEFRLRRA